MGRGRRERSDARRNRAAIVDAAAARLARGDALGMGKVADAAGVSRSTLYRHFPRLEDLDRALVEQALAEADRLATRAASEEAPALAVLRRLVNGLVGIGATYRIDASRARTESSAENTAAALLPLVRRLGRAAAIDPIPPERWLREAGRHFLETCLDVGARGHGDARAAAETLFAQLTEPLDRGLVVLDPGGVLIAVNPSAARAVDPDRRPAIGQRLTAPRVEVTYEDGFPSDPEAYPLHAVVSGREDRVVAVRGHRQPTGEVAWIAVEACALCRLGADRPYGVLGILSDVTAEKASELRRMRPPGRLGRERPVPLDIARTLDEIPPHLFPEQFASEARRITGAPVALYVLDIDGSHLLRLAGAVEFPARLEAPLALGPELAQDGIPGLRAKLESELPGVGVAPMWVRGRAIGVLLGLRVTDDSLAELAWHAAPAMELARGYTDVFDGAQRRKETTAAAELQQSLVPPRIARIGGGELAGSVFPAYEVGGDWFDYVENRDGAWIALADAVGKGPTAAALGGIALAALRAARRSDQSLEAAARAMHEAVYDVGQPEFFVTAIVARWLAVYSSFSWINCGHPPPLLVRGDHTVEQLMTASSLPLGLMERERRFTRHQRRLEDGERLILHSDGITARRTPNGLFGLGGIERVLEREDSRSATATAKGIQEAVLDASVDELRDDAVVVVLAPASEASPSR